MTQRLLIIVCLTCAAMPPQLGATCMQPGPPCEVLAEADLVFIADVLEATPVPGPDGRPPPPQGIMNYRFNVLEGLKGIKPGEFRAQFYFGGSLDRDEFAAGGRYLIFANGAKTGIYTSSCGRSRRTSEREWFPRVRAELDLCLKKP